jgi:hypothetical protein
MRRTPTYPHAERERRALAREPIAAESEAPNSRRSGGSYFVDVVPVVVAVQFLVFGVWAFGWPHSFYLTIARFPPFSQHLVHDAGAFQLGLGTTMLLGLVWKHDAVFAVLAGGSVATVTHAVSHITDRHLGGRDGDPWQLSVLAVLLLIATALRARLQVKGTRR